MPKNKPAIKTEIFTEEFADAIAAASAGFAEIGAQVINMAQAIQNAPTINPSAFLGRELTDAEPGNWYSTTRDAKPGEDEAHSYFSSAQEIPEIIEGVISFITENDFDGSRAEKMRELYRIFGDIDPVLAAVVLAGKNGVSLDEAFLSVMTGGGPDGGPYGNVVSEFADKLKRSSGLGSITIKDGGMVFSMEEESPLPPIRGTIFSRSGFVDEFYRFDGHYKNLAQGGDLYLVVPLDAASYTRFPASLLVILVGMRGSAIYRSVEAVLDQSEVALDHAGALEIKVMHPDFPRGVHLRGMITAGSVGVLITRMLKDRGVEASGQERVFRISSLELLQQ